jgi:hypothetical protein
LEGLDDDDMVRSEVSVLGKTVMMEEVESSMYSSVGKRQAHVLACVPPLTSDLKP